MRTKTFKIKPTRMTKFHINLAFLNIGSETDFERKITVLNV